MNYRLAKFSLRLLAMLLDLTILLLPHTIFFFLVITRSTNLAMLIYSTLLYLMIFVLPFFIITNLIYDSFLTTYFGGTIGKLLTGLAVVNEKGQYLNLRRSLFRHTIGYGFAGLLFGVGFLSIIKDENKQGWHDKAVGSFVIVTKNIWPLALFILMLLIAANIFLIVSGVKIISSGPLIKDAERLMEDLSQPKVPEMVPDLEESSPSASSGLI